VNREGSVEGGRGGSWDERGASVPDPYVYTPPRGCRRSGERMRMRPIAA